MIKFHAEEIEIFKPRPGYFEQSSTNIWSKVCKCVRAVTSELSDKSLIKGIGFDATCSLVLIDTDKQPLTASPTLNNDQNIIMWMDHRAEKEANFINSLAHDCLKYVGGKVSLEMEIPKLLWLKNNLFIDSYSKIRYAFDLPDFLTFMATENTSRSACSLTCKWNYDAVNGEFPMSYFNSIGLSELCDDNFSKIGKNILFPGDFYGILNEQAAKDMNLLKGIPVGTSMIDAHAGALGLIGSTTEKLGDINLTSKLVLIAGTSTCHMSITENALFTDGIWGPYKNALIPNHFLAEGGQSASGVLVDYILSSHPDYEKVSSELNGRNIHDYLHDEIMNLAALENLKTYHELTKDFHIYPDFHGNRSPLSDSSMRGMVCGLSMHDSIFVTYLAIIQALCYGTKHIIDSLYKAGRDKFKLVLICGGLSKNKLFLQTTADVCKIPVLVSYEPECVLLGASILGATASKIYPDLKTAISDLKSEAYQIEANTNSFEFHSRKYKVFLKMLSDQKSYKEIMDSM